MKCRCCGNEMASFTQEYPPKYNRPPVIAITCWNTECKLEGQTLNAADYATRDLTDYMQTKKRKASDE